MSKNSSHDKTAKYLAKKFNIEYNEGKGPDIIAKNKTIEVEKAKTINDAKRQLQGYRGPVYIAGADGKATKEALKLAKNTTIGVMNNKGNILKKSTRKKK